MRLLDYTRLHALGVKLFLRLWTESAASTSDFDRIATLVASQLKASLKNTASQSWFDLEKWVEMLYQYTFIDLSQRADVYRLQPYQADANEGAGYRG